MAIFTAGYVVLTLIINAPLLGPLMTILKLDRISEEQLHMRRHVRGKRHMQKSCIFHL